MLDWIVNRHRAWADFVVVVSAPDAESAMRRQLESLGVAGAIAIQAEPAGMLPAIQCAESHVRSLAPDEIWITWCDQVGISDGTLRQLAGALSAPDVAFALPLVRQSPPYIHIVRDDSGRITDVLQRREGAAMPDTGDSDAGLFGMRRDVFLDDLAAFARLAPAGAATGERNFLPFIPWLAARRSVRTFVIDDPREARGVNTPQDLADMDQYLAGRG